MQSNITQIAQLTNKYGITKTTPGPFTEQQNATETQQK